MSICENKGISNTTHPKPHSFYFTPPHPPSNLFLQVSSIVVNGITIWAQAQNLTSNLFTSPLVSLQHSEHISHYFPLTPRPKPYHPYPTQLRKAPNYFLCFYSCLPTVTLHTAAKANFENNKSDHATRLLKTFNGFPLSSVKSQLLTSASKLHMAGPCLSPQSLFITISFCHKVHSRLRAFAPAASLPQKTSP